MAKVQDPLSGLWIEEGQIYGRAFSDDYKANYLDRDLFTSFYQYAKDAGRAVAHNERLYGRSAQKIQDNFGPIRPSGNRAQNMRDRNRVQNRQAQLSAAMAGQREGWYAPSSFSGKPQPKALKWHDYRPPTDFDGSTRGTTKHSLILRKNRV